MKVCWFLLMMASVSFSTAQTFNLYASIKNQPYNTVAIGAVSGDNFILSDSIPTRNIITSAGPVKTISWNFPPDAAPGTYRVVLGMTTYARVMNEPPQQFDFIFNGENIRIETDYLNPFDSLKVLQSAENIVWYEFLKKETAVRKALEALEKDEAFYRIRLKELLLQEDAPEEEVSEVRTALVNVTNQLNQIQMERENIIERMAGADTSMLVSHYIRAFREPFRDGFLSPEERNAFFQKEYLRYIDFSDEALIHSSVLTDKIFNYLVTYNQRGFSQEQRQEAYIKAVEAVMADVKKKAGQHGVVYAFVLDYLVDGFERLKMEKVLAWISKNYGETSCSFDDKSALQRKMGAQKMKPGGIVPEFALHDLRGRPVQLSQVLGSQNLIIFWASWCTHCSSLLPQIKKLASENKNLKIIAVSIDKSADEWHKAVYRAGIEGYCNLSDQNEWAGQVARDYNIHAVPAMFLVDGNRRLIAKPFTIEELAKAVTAF